jgi:hypothetical protein
MSAYSNTDPSQRSVPAEVLLRQEPEDEDEETDGDEEGDDDQDDEEEDGYSE